MVGESVASKTYDYEAVFSHYPDGFAVHEMILDRHGLPVDYRFLAVNSAFELLTGLKAEAILGKTVLEVMPQTEKHWIETYGRVALTGDAIAFENYSQAIDKFFEVRAFRTKPNHFACLFRDITSKIKKERKENPGRTLGEIDEGLSGLVQILDVTLMRVLEENAANLRDAEKAGVTFAGVRDYLTLRKMPDLLQNCRDSVASLLEKLRFRQDPTRNG